MTISVFEEKNVHPSGVSVESYVKSLEEAGDADSNSPSVPSKIRLAVVGGGLMGCSIAAAFLRKSIPILLYDLAEGARQAAPERIAEELAFQLSAQKTTPTDADRVEARRLTTQFLTVTSNFADLDQADLLLETIVEKTKVKQKFYRNLDAVCSGPKRLLTNTSTIQITELAAGLTETVHLSADRFCGFHFFHPVRKRSLVEIIRGQKTKTQTITDAATLARQIDKSPILVEDGPGFLVNRLLNPYLNEAMTLLLEGVTMDRIDAVCGRFGMEMGPFRIMDEIGLDVTFHSGWTFFKAFPEFIDSGELLPAMIESGRLGRKNGRGFRLYETVGNWSDEGKPDKTLDALIQNVSRFSSEKRIFREEGTPLNGPEISDETLALRVFVAVLTEAVRIIDAGIVTKMEETDRALDFGLGFPKRRGGIAYWADSFGLARLVTVARELTRLNPKFAPPESLLEIVRRNGTLVCPDKTVSPRVSS